MLEENKTEIRLERHKTSQEDFTPRSIVEKLYEGSEELFTDFKKTILDPCAGICYILIYCLEQRLKHCTTEKDIISALSTIYGTELYEDNCIEGRQNLMNTITDYTRDNNIVLTKKSLAKIQAILEHNIAQSDTFEWDYENWCPIKHQTYFTDPLF